MLGVGWTVDTAIRCSRGAETEEVLTPLAEIRVGYSCYCRSTPRWAVLTVVIALFASHSGLHLKILTKPFTMHHLITV